MVAHPYFFRGRLLVRLRWTMAIALSSLGQFVCPKLFRSLAGLLKLFFFLFFFYFISYSSSSSSPCAPSSSSSSYLFFRWGSSSSSTSPGTVSNSILFGVLKRTADFVRECVRKKEVEMEGIKEIERGEGFFSSLCQEIQERVGYEGWGRGETP